MLVPVTQVPVNREVRNLAAAYIRAKLMPADSLDALHVAAAAIHQIDYLLTWNCRHMANANKVAHFRSLHTRLGIHLPVITTPYTLIPEPPQ